MKEKNLMVVAGGGTGGHFFCGLAFAEKYVEKHAQSEVVFIGVKKGIEARHKFEDKRMRVEFIPASGFKNQSFGQKFDAFVKLIDGFFVSLAKLIKLRPQIVVGVGGYASAPTMLAATFLRPFLKFRVALIEQNSAPGIVNKFFSFFLPAYSPFPRDRFQALELPLKGKIEELAKAARPASWPPQTILVLGGSQGAQGLNRAMISLAPDLKTQCPNIKIIHQAGAQGLEFVKAAYNDIGLSSEVFAFSTEIYRYMSDADLVISRSGALSVFELIQFKRPTVFVPFPFAADDHQFKNALAVQTREWVIPETEFNWKRLESILKSSRPSIPQLRSSRLGHWRSLLP